MKRHNNLFKKITSMSNIYLAHHNAKRGKTKYKEVKTYENDRYTHTKKIKEILEKKVWIPSASKKAIIMEKKPREITKVNYYPDRVIHHALMQVVDPVFSTVYIKDSYQSIKGRGVHKAVKRVKEWMREEEQTKYCLKLDIKKFYPSLKAHIIKKYYRKKIKCQDTLWLLDRIVDSEDGLPIGHYTSQTLGNFVMSYFDHYAKSLGAKKYIRYADDIVIFSDNKEFLHDLRVKLDSYISENMELKIKDNWQVFETRDRGLDFLGYRFFDRFILIRKSIATNMKRAFKRPVRSKNDLSRIFSYLGWAKFANSYNLLRKLLPNIQFSVALLCEKIGISNPLKKIYIIPKPKALQLTLF